MEKVDQNKAKAERDIATFMCKLKAAISSRANVAIGKLDRDWQTGFSVSRLGNGTRVEVLADSERTGSWGYRRDTGRFFVRAAGKLYRARGEWPQKLIDEIAAYTLQGLEKAVAETKREAEANTAAVVAKRAIEAAGLSEGDVSVTTQVGWRDHVLRIQLHLPELTVEQAIAIGQAARKVLEG